MSQPACPSVEHLLARSDGGLARIRRPGGRLDADGLTALAEAADRFGSGTVEMTNRANLQIRGVRPGAGSRLAAALVSAGLSCGPSGDRRRNVLMGPLGGLDPDAVDYGPLLDPLLAALDSDPRLDALDDKFGMALDGGGAWPLSGRRAAIVARPGADPRSVVVTCGWAPPRTVERAELVGVLASAAADSIGRPYRSVVVPGPAAPPVGPLGAGPGWVGAMPPLGRAGAATLVGLAELARRHSGGALRLTTWRGVVFPEPTDADRLMAGLRRLDLVVDRDDPAGAVVACAGTAGCTSALTDATGDAQLVIRARRQREAPVVGIHVSGCAKRCAQRAPADVTLVGAGPGRYDLYRGEEIGPANLSASEAVEEASRP